MLDCKLVLFLVGLSSLGQLASAADRPNVLIIMVDDLGYSDLGCYGGEIETPRLDALAANGLRFSQFYNTAKCHSSRVSLLTGQYCIAAGDTALSNTVTSAEMLAQAGYFTAMTGKWHLKKEPTDFGFQRYFGHLSGACNFFRGDNTFRLNGNAWTVPSQGFYTTVANVDYAIDFLNQARATEKPWYLYVAFNAPHAPLHALAEDYARYEGNYSEGWDVARQRRVKKQKEIGLLPGSLVPSPRPEHIPAWEDMAPWRQKYEANRMSTLAAMIDCVDREVGRLVDDLSAHNELDNTFLLFVSDNGACPYDRKRPILDARPVNGEVAFGDSTGWAWARNTPFRYYKQNQYEGGISTPGIVHWPAGLDTSPGAIVDDPAHLIDVLPTLEDITAAERPASWPDRDLRPVSGISLKPVFLGERLARKDPLHFLFATDRGIRMGDWKAVSFRSSAWELYNLREDRTERIDLASTHPARLSSMVASWTDMAANTLHAGPKHTGPVGPAMKPHQHREWTRFDQPIPNGNPARQRIRARKNTKLNIEGESLHLVFTGEDPGLAFDLRGRDLPAGPYLVSFELVGGTPGGGNLFFTVDAKRTLPKGTLIEFDVPDDNRKHEITIELPTSKTIHQLRLDVSDGPGRATISRLRLRNRQGDPILSWPERQND